MRTHTIIEIESDQVYQCCLDSFNRIVLVVPYNEYLYMRPIKEVYDKFKDRAKFKVLTKDIPPDLLIGEDKYRVMVKKNPKLDTLRETFDCYII